MIGPQNNFVGKPLLKENFGQLPVPEGDGVYSRGTR